MAEFHVAAIPIGRLDVEEIEAAISRAVKVFRRPMELRDALPVPREAEDSERGQYRAAMVMKRLSTEVLKLKPGKLVGSSEEDARTPYQPDALIFLTDIDLFTAKTDGVMSALLPVKRCAVTSVRRLREAFYRRKADPVRQRARLVKEILRMAGRLSGLKECSDPQCLLAPSKSVLDIDTKDERYCRGCEERLFEGKLLI